MWYYWDEAAKSTENNINNSDFYLCTSYKLRNEDAPKDRLAT